MSPQTAIIPASSVIGFSSEEFPRLSLAAILFVLVDNTDSISKVVTCLGLLCKTLILKFNLLITLTLTDVYYRWRFLASKHGHGSWRFLAVKVKNKHSFKSSRTVPRQLFATKIPLICVVLEAVGCRWFVQQISLSALWHQHRKSS